MPRIKPGLILSQNQCACPLIKSTCNLDSMVDKNNNSNNSSKYCLLITCNVLGIVIISSSQELIGRYNHYLLVKMRKLRHRGFDDLPKVDS